MSIRNLLSTLVIIIVGTTALSGQLPTPQQESAATIAFRNAVVLAPKKPSTPVFKLSHTYPHSTPGKCEGCGWLNIPVNFATQFGSDPKKIEPPKWHGQHWDEYINAILNYVKEDQDAQLSNDIGWKTTVKGKTRWFNVPWMAYDPTAGREYVHGTTNERTATLGDLVQGSQQGPHVQFFMAGEKESCKTDYPWGFESWSVGYYNEFGGYALGRTMPTSGIPQMGEYLGTPVPAGLPFPTGTVVVKILTSNIPVDCVPFLRGSPEWMVDRHKYTKANGYECDREVQPNHVVQVDVAVVDPRSPTRWVYGTFAYDGNTPGTTFWDHLVPVGLQWGSDPWTFPAVPLSASLPLQQSVINTDSATFQHLGCKDRLAGPVDNQQSSCTSCHASAYAAPKGAPGIMGSNVPPSFGFNGMCQAYSLENSAYFQNQSAPQRFPGGQYGDAFTMDTSLQLEVAFTQYGYYNTDRAPQTCTDPNQITPPRKAAEAAIQKKVSK
jgi:hypothetical protein